MKIQLLESRKIKFLPEHEMNLIPESNVRYGQICVNDRYIIIYDGIYSRLIFCNHDLTIIAMLPIPRSSFLTCTNNFVYMTPHRCGLMRFTPEVLIRTYLFESLNIFVMTANIETNLLYFRCASRNEMFIGNEQGEVLHQVSTLCTFSNIFVSWDNIILTANTFKSRKGLLTLFNQDGKQITQIEDRHLLTNNVCILYNKGIIVAVANDQLHLWCMV
jgi:hypothetical protein